VTEWLESLGRGPVERLDREVGSRAQTSDEDGIDGSDWAPPLFVGERSAPPPSSSPSPSALGCSPSDDWGVSQSDGQVVVTSAGAAELHLDTFATDFERDFNSIFEAEDCS